MNGKNSTSTKSNNHDIINSIDAEEQDLDRDQERERFLARGTNLNSTSGSRTTASVGSLGNKSTTKMMPSTLSSVSKRKAKLAREETMDYDYDPAGSVHINSNSNYKHNSNNNNNSSNNNNSNTTTCLGFLKKKRIFIPLILISCIAAIYCVPYIEIEPRIPKKLPNIPFNFQEGPLRASTFSSFKVDRMFQDQIRGPESLAFDSSGNMYLAIEGGFILYVHLNRSSPLRRAYYELPQNQGSIQGLTGTQSDQISVDDVLNQIVKIAELNGIKQVPYYEKQGKRKARGQYETVGAWRRECDLDEKIYGQNLFTGGLQPTQGQSVASSSNEIDPEARKFKSHVYLSRCSKPLGIRLSPDESYLYVVDTLSGLYRISLKMAERPYSTQRLVSRIVDFKPGKNQLLPVIQLDRVPSGGKSNNLEQTATTPVPTTTLSSLEATGGSTIKQQLAPPTTRAYLNISLKAIDDLVIDYGAGYNGGDLIYMTLASQNWMALSYIYDLMEGRPSGAVLRYDSGLNQLSIMDPIRLAEVRTSVNELENLSSRLYTKVNESSDDPYMGIGAPRLDENDVFDTRPLHFPNGIELTDDRQAILIADTSNKRIIKHYVRGPRRGTSDLWAWTPMIPDNIRRGLDKSQETYWVVGCGHDTTDVVDPLVLLNNWPRVRKFLLKNIYLIGYLVEMFGKHVLRSNRVRDFGYSFKIGNSMCESFCPGMMILQYNKYGDIMRSIHGKEFPNDLAYYSQVNEVLDPITKEQILYLGSPSYNYITKLVLPQDVHPSYNAWDSI